MKQAIGLALGCCLAAAGCKKDKPQRVEEAERSLPDSAESADLEVRYQLAIDGTSHEVTAAPIKTDGVELTVRERSNRRYRGEQFAFDYPSRVRVGATPIAVTAASGTSMVKLLVLDRGEAEAITKEALAELQSMTGGTVKDGSRTIAGKAVAGKTVVTTGADRAKELYSIPIGDADTLHIELLHPLGADLADLLALLESIAPGKSEPKPDFDLLAGGKPVAELMLDTPAKVEVAGKEHELVISNRPMVRRRIGRLSFEHPPNAAVAKQTNPLGSGVQIGLDNTAITAMLISGSPAELRSAIAGQGVPKGPVSASIGGSKQSGTSMSMFGGVMMAELYLSDRGGETFMVMVQYSPTIEGAREAAAPVLASIKAK